jgi:hypothetical protein
MRIDAKQVRTFGIRVKPSHKIRCYDSAKDSHSFAAKFVEIQTRQMNGPEPSIFNAKLFQTNGEHTSKSKGFKSIDPM